MSKYKLKFTLKQHTPIIHFQHDQHGATLRASELKPKLDKFLIEKLELTEIKTIEGKEKEVPKKEVEKWFNNKEKLSLDYKVRIEDDKNVKYYLPLALTYYSNKLPQKENNAKNFILNYYRTYYSKNFDFDFLAPTPYFANQDKIKFGGYYNNQKLNKDIVNLSDSKPEELRFAVQSNSDINLTISSFVQNKVNNKKLLGQIEDCIEEFFIMNNFGARQNKGFGSFTVKEINSKKVTNSNYKIKNIFYAKSKNDYITFKDIFSFILKEYQLLKSGINIPFGKNPQYEKSKLFEYFIDKRIRWEKRFIKQKLNNINISLKHNYEPIDFNDITKEYYNSYEDVKKGNKYKFIRALLGLAEHFEFVDNRNNRLKVKIENISNKDNEKIVRFKSPIFFKVFENKVYLSYNNSYKMIEGKNFDFKYNNKSLGDLDIPTNFEINDFLDKYLLIASINWEKI